MPVIDIEPQSSLDAYSEFPNLALAVQDLRVEAERIAGRMRGRSIWMVNSTAQGGGVAEMLPTSISLMRELGMDVKWFVMETEREEFFALTKRLHNLMHGEGDPELSRTDRDLYEEVSQENAELLGKLISEDDILIIHDPQPYAMGSILAREMDVLAFWRCHIGLEQRNDATSAAWNFLRRYAEPYAHSVFTLPQYIPSYLTGRATIIYPAVDPLSPKNRVLSLQRLVSILTASSLLKPREEHLTTPFPEPAMRLQRDGSYAPAIEPDDFGLIFRPVITQISRWDRLKGFAPLLSGFARMKKSLDFDDVFRDDRHRRTVDLARLVLAGPDPGSVQDDPEAQEVLAELKDLYLSLPASVQADVAIISLPMTSREHNALMVNALQRVSTIVAQNSLHEGFGLTCTEAMWKGVPVLAARRGGLRAQIRDDVDGRMVDEPNDPDEVASVLTEMLADDERREEWGRSANRRVYDHFLVFSQISDWLNVIERSLINREVGASVHGQG